MPVTPKKLSDAQEKDASLNKSEKLGSDQATNSGKSDKTGENSATSKKNGAKKQNASKAKKAERKVRVKINSRVVFAPGGKGSHAVQKKETGFASMFKAKAAPPPPSIGVAKSHVYQGTKPTADPHKASGGAEQALKEWVPDARNDPYAYWRVVKQAAAKQAKAKKLLTAVERVVGNLIHCVHSKPFVPPEAQKHHAPEFDLVTVEEFKLICNAARVVCLKEETLVNVEPPCKVFGDIHGQVSDLIQFFRQYGAPSHRVGDINICKYIFIGDFVDRGAYSLEVLLILLCLKLRYHPHIILLRGNHEERMMNQQFGFVDEIQTRLGSKAGKTLYEDEIYPFFQVLPLAATIDKRILCIHGGPGLHVRKLEDIRKIKRPLKHETFRMVPGDDQQNMIVDLMWSDPTNIKGLSKDKDLTFNSSLEQLGRCPWSGMGFNYDRAVGTRFGPDVIERFCKENDLDLIIRAHECVDRGWQIYAEGRAITLFSAPKYGGGEDAVNSGAILEVSRALNIQCKAISAGDTKGVWSNTQKLDRGRGHGSSH